MDQLDSPLVIHRVSVRPRPRICQYVSANRNRTVPLDELTAHLVADREPPGDEPTDGQPDERVRLALHHVHLPKLDDVDVIDYDYGRRTVDPDGNLSTATGLLEPDRSITLLD